MMKIVIVRKELKDREWSPGKEEYEKLRIEIDMSANEFMELPEPEKTKLMTMVINKSREKK